VIAGGTDILPNLKHFLDTPPMLVSLARVTALRGVARDDAAGVLRIGAGVTLTQIWRSTRRCRRCSRAWRTRRGWSRAR
jgi:CO/xanthine dehydrogenase FAD-binding subunit